MNEYLMRSDIARMIDLSAVRAESDDASVRELVAAAQRLGCWLVTALPSQTRLARQLLDEAGSRSRLGGNVGFPSGGQTQSIKAAETRELIGLGCDEIDVVINLAALRSGRCADVLADLRGVVEAAESRPVKVILECAYLSADEMRRGCDAAVQAGAAFVKTGSGWAPGGATVEQVAAIKAHVGEAIAIKASGGIRSLAQLMELFRAGARRFGISMRAGESILNEAGYPVDR